MAVQQRGRGDGGLHRFVVKVARIGAQALSLALVAGLLALLIWKVSHQVGDSTVASELRDGASPEAPAFVLPRLDTDAQLASDSLKGKVQVLNFWASWCVPCREEAGLLQSASKQWRSRDVVVLGVDHQDFAGDARGFMRRYGMTYPVVEDKGDKLYRRYGATGVPETFCINRDGEVVVHVPGAVTRDSLNSCIQGALES
jgi:cytochrome c biogenesis protein CcmG, thiol:disulfide interchange protein DsbE